MHAVILAGGLSRRLGGVPKASLLVEGETLLSRSVRAAESVMERAAESATEEGSGARARIAVVGPVDGVAAWLGSRARSAQVEMVQEDPPFSGPASGIAAGLVALGGEEGRVLVLACDMPQAARITRLLAGALSNCAPGEGVMAVDAGRRQPLAAIYPLAPLREAVEAARAAHRLENASVFSLLANVNTKECAVPAGLAADIDTWDDARLHGIDAPQ